MKTIRFVIVILFFGCHVLFAQKKVALVTFYCDEKIGGTGLGTAAESLINDPSFNLQTWLLKRGSQEPINDKAPPVIWRGFCRGGY